MKPLHKGTRRIWIVRHGVSTFNASGRYQGSSDESQLTPEGRQAARATAAFFAGLDIRLVITSPLERARETAREIFERMRGAAANPAAFQEDERLREISLPAWEGLTFEEVRSRFPELYQAWRSSPQSMSMASPEVGVMYPVLELFDRVGRFWESLRNGEEHGDVVVVTHAGAGRALISRAFGLGPERFHSLQLSNCGISLIELWGEKPRRASLETLNATDHLDDRLPKLKEGRTGVRFLLIAAGNGGREQAERVTKVLAGTPIETALVAGMNECAAGDFPWLAPTAAFERVMPETLWLRMKAETAFAGGPAVATIAVVGPADVLRPAIQNLLALENAGGGTLPLYPAAVTVLHCPGGGRQPVLQGMNLFQPAQLRVGVSA